ncbi:MAG: chromosomal replication initiator protein DnaA [Clostridia bacterium]|nr:chromosomal replication initiator protein DnaA [Clostridia bacterium]
MNSFEDVWKQALEKLEAISPILYQIYYSKISNIEYSDGVVVIRTDSDYLKQIIEHQLIGELSDTLAEIMGFAPHIDVELFEPGAPAPVPPDDNMTFERFVEGPSNTLAYNAAKHVAEAPGTAFNPLYIYGHSGLGKTHLLLAIKNEVAKTNPFFNIIYISGENFTNDLIVHMRHKDMAAFHDKYRSADVLLVDDIQFIQNKVQTQEEFFHTFNALTQSGRQIAVTSDVPPNKLPTLNERLRTRFEAGMIVDIGAPAEETRMAILQNRFAERGLKVPAYITEYIARSITSNIRKLEGAVVQLDAICSLSGGEPTLEDAKRIVGGLAENTLPPEITTEKVLSTVSEFYGVTQEDILSEKRTANVAEARQISMFAIRETTQLGLQSIGALFGKQHSTVHHSIEKTQKRIQEDPAFSSHVSMIIKDIRGEY